MTILYKTKLYLCAAFVLLAFSVNAYSVSAHAQNADTAAMVPNVPPVETVVEAQAEAVAKDVVEAVIDAPMTQEEIRAEVVVKPPAPIIHAAIMDMPAVTTASNDPASADYPILRVTQDKSEMVTLETEAASVIVGNPNHISVLLDTPTTLVVVPRAPGASHFTVMGKDGSVVMQRHVIVGAAKEQYVRIRRSCSAGDRNCQPTSTYFCPDMCHEVQENTQGQRRR